MMFGKNGKSSGACTVCRIVGTIIGIVVLLSTIAALVGVYKAHFLLGGATFGTTNGSLALIALAVNLMFLKKMSRMCPCGGMCACDVKK